MKSEKIINSTKMGSQPLLWKQAVTGAPHRGWSLRNIILYPLIKYKYTFKNHQSFLCDTLIIGSNPVLNLLLLKKLATLSFINQKHIKVGILNIADGDYWAYHELKKELFWSDFSQHLTFKVKALSNFVSDIIKQTSWEYLEPVFINADNMSIQYIKQDNISKFYIAHLIEKEIDKTVFSPQMPTVIDSENQLKKNLWENLLRNFLNLVPSAKKLSWKEPAQTSHDNEEKSHIVLANSIFLTSLPQGWLNMEVTKDNGYTKFQHMFSNSSFGSAVKIANDFHLLEKQVMQDIKEVERLKL